jgi:hypothetical protein
MVRLNCITHSHQCLVINSTLNRTKILLRETPLGQEIKTLFVCWKVVFFLKMNSGKVNYFPMFGSVMENKLENTFQCLVMS